VYNRSKDMDNIKDIVQMLETDKKELRTWQKVADKYGVSKATVNAICKRGYIPKDKSIRNKLGITNNKKRYPVWAIDIDEQEYLKWCRREYRNDAN